MKKFLTTLTIALAAGYGGAWLFYQQHEPAATAAGQVQFTALEADSAAPEAVPLGNHRQVSRQAAVQTLSDFVEASRISTRSVVYIKNISEHIYRQSFMEYFFGLPGQTAETISSGSGVIFSADGYIVTNNHVIADADRLEVIHGKQSYEATLIGTDPSSDLAVLKVEGSDLPAIPLGSSKGLQVGEWVIAVGNPFNLTSTVTAGIVSAKARALNIVQDKFPIESFIQTDAAINPGNSGGALVNIKGELVGINTAILSRTGSYAGYGFAVPVDIVKKVVSDIIRYGEVQKAFIGATVVDLDADVAHRLSLPVSNLQGVLVVNVEEGWAADRAGIREGDIILELDGLPVNTKAEYDEVLSYRSPGDKISIKWQSGKKVKTADIVLTNREGTTGVVKRRIYTSRYLGADLEVVSKLERDMFDIEHGVKIVKLYAGGLLARLELEEGFIITGINQYKIDTPQRLAEVLAQAYGRVRIEGVSKSGRKGYYSFYLR